MPLVKVSSGLQVDDGGSQRHAIVSGDFLRGKFSMFMTT